jgi:hypothetical protein
LTWAYRYLGIQVEQLTKSAYDNRRPVFAHDLPRIFIILFPGDDILRSRRTMRRRTMRYRSAIFIGSLEPCQIDLDDTDG